MTQLQTTSHRRQNLLTGEWVLVSPQRTERPWQGLVETPATGSVPAYDPACYLCPGNARSRGAENPGYTGPWAFENDFPALSADAQSGPVRSGPFRSEPETGRCRVVCYTHRHDLCMPAMAPDELDAAVAFLFREFGELDRDPGIGYVQIFENRGAMMGCSNAHPHAQIWATGGLPVEPAKELGTQRAWLEGTGRSLLLDYLAAELDDGSRLVCENERAVALVPFWAVWPFETLLVPRRRAAGPDELRADDVRGLAQALQATLRAYDRLFDTPMPYSLGFHPRPSDGTEHPEWQFHAHIYPPLLRSATVRKHMVGFEMLGMPQRDLTPEAAAERLRSAFESGEEV
jgi:UDPglucose--hexose-1-phosphate uridylyltransferase